MSQMLAPVSVLRKEINDEFGRRSTIEVKDILDHFGVRFNEVLFLVNGKVPRPNTEIKLDKDIWSMLSLTIGG